MKKLLILAVFAAAVAFGQSGVFNLPYKPQPRILIPHIEAPQVFVVDGELEANPYRGLKYCDFVLKCVSQSTELYALTEAGTATPLLYLYASAVVIDAPFVDTNAVVFYQNAALPWPERVQRVSAASVTRTNSAIVTNVIREEWDAHLSTNCYPPSVLIRNRQDVWVSVPVSGFVGGKPRYAFGTLVTYFDVDSWRVEQDAVWVFYQNSLYNGLVRPTDEQWAYYSITTNVVTNYTVIVGGPVQIVSSNQACAIEVYPDPSKFRSWMKQGNKDVKWMCLLSNGIDFYRDAQSGEPMWFNVEIEWVDKRPEEGEWGQ